MIKRIPVSKLCLGMFVHNLHSSWIKHPFLFSSFFLDSAKKLQRILDSGITEVDIDTDKGMDVELPRSDPGHQTRAAPESDQGSQTSVGTYPATVSPKTPLSTPLPPLPGVMPVAVGQEVERARHVQREANIVMQGVLTDVRIGRQIKLEKVEGVVGKVTDSILRNRDALVSLTRIKEKDNYTFQHSVSVCALLIAFCRELGYDRATIENVGIGGMLHDVGKMRVPGEILNKPGPLTAEEFEIMKSHAALAPDILGQTPGISQMAIDIAEHHHERYDGTGYPHGLKGDEISVFSQLAAIADVYDAMTSVRVYRKAMDPGDVLKKIYELRSSHFRGELALGFIRMIGIYPVGTLVGLKSGYLAVVVEQHKEDLLRPRVRILMNMKKRCMTPQRDVDLSHPERPDKQDVIVGPELPSYWEIDPFACL
jgi:putative nucleotidyltransferase with HDIG domain